MPRQKSMQKADFYTSSFVNLAQKFDWFLRLGVQPQILVFTSIQSWKKTLLGVSFLCLGREKPHGTMKHFSREYEDINICSREPKSHQKLFNPKAPIANDGGCWQCATDRKQKSGFGRFFSKKKGAVFTCTWHDLELCLFQWCSSPRQVGAWD